MVWQDSCYGAVLFTPGMQKSTAWNMPIRIAVAKTDQDFFLKKAGMPNDGCVQ